jgi:ATP-binding cassette subfamily G (WHITE) protein 2 (PDR)
MVNEFHDRDFPCAYFVPSGSSYGNVAADQRACAVQGSVAGSGEVSGTAFVSSAYGYEYANRWRDFGVIIALTLVLLLCHLVTTELVASARSKGEVLVFRRSRMHKAKAKQLRMDEETGTTPAMLAEKSSDKEGSGFKVEQHASVFHWEDVCYEVQIKDQTRKILDNVDGWIKPGTLTALMVAPRHPLELSFH